KEGRRRGSGYCHQRRPSSGAPPSRSTVTRESNRDRAKHASRNQIGRGTEEKGQRKNMKNERRGAISASSGA
ncbi:hypothetical protein U1Q18_014981, partial [Sarracenia purpurea var. burkii]